MIFFLLFGEGLGLRSITSWFDFGKKGYFIIWELGFGSIISLFEIVEKDI